MSAAMPQLDLGKLLRVRSMVSAAAQMEATYQAGGALVRAYRGLREEMLLVLEPEALSSLREEFTRLFPDMEVPRPHLVADQHRSAARLSESAAEAQLSLRRLEGW